MFIDFGAPRPGHPGRAPPVRSVSLEMNMAAKGAQGQYPLMRNNSPYSLMQQQGMMGNHSVMPNQPNMVNAGEFSCGQKCSALNVEMTLNVHYQKIKAKNEACL